MGYNDRNGGYHAFHESIPLPLVTAREATTGDVGAIAAGLFLAAAFGLLAWRNYAKDTAWTTRVVVPTMLAIVGLAAAIAFALVLIL